MSTCNHTAWLSFHDGESLLFSHTSALSDIVAGLETPAETWPSLVVLVDDTKSRTLISHVLPAPSRRSIDDEHKGVSLQLDGQTAFSDRPVLIACSDFRGRSKLTPEPDVAPCHWHKVRETGDASEDIFQDLHCNLLNTFAHVVCLFASEQGGYANVIDYLEAWSRRIPNLPKTNPRPRILIVATPGESRKPTEVKQALLEALQQRSTGHEVEFTVFVIQSGRPPLRDRVRLETDISRQVRAQKYALLNALHLEQLFYRGCDRFVESAVTAFDLLGAARLHRPVSASLGAHLGDVFGRLQSCSDMTAFAAPYIAECLLLDNYTADVHGRSRSLCYDWLH